MNPALFLFEAAFISMFCLLLQEMHDLACLFYQPKVNKERSGQSLSVVGSIEGIIDIKMEKFSTIAERWVVSNDLVVPHYHIDYISSNDEENSNKDNQHNSPLSLPK